MVDINTQENQISVNVSSAGNNTVVSAQSTDGKNTVNALPDMSMFYTERSREWAISDNIVNNEDYSSKYYAQKSKEQAQISTEKTKEVVNSGNEALSNIDNAKNNAIIDLTNQETLSIDNIKTEGAKQVTLATNQANIATEKANIATTQAGIATAKTTEVVESGNTALSNITTAKSNALNEINTTGAGYVENAEQYAQNALTSANNAAVSESNALSYKNSIQESAQTAAEQSNIAVTNANKAITSATNAKISETNAKSSETRCEEILSRLGTAIKIKGRVDSVRDLPLGDNLDGDAYLVGEEGLDSYPEYYWYQDRWEFLGTSGGGGTWGTITGDITAQSDLIEKFDTKQDKLTSKNAGENITIKEVQSGGLLPRGYTQLDYIQATGSQYIIIPSREYYENDEIEINFAYTSFEGSFPTVFGSINSEIYTNSNGAVLSYANISVLEPNIFLLNEMQTIKAIFTKVFISSQALFAYLRSANTPDFPSQGKIGGYKHKRGDKVLANYIPAKRNSDDEIGMYDIVSNTFFTNEGTGTFNAGNIVTQEVAKTTVQISAKVPTKTSELINDSNFITSENLPTKTSQLTNDSNFITSSYHDSTKQDVISDLETIRQGASKGATALQSYTETDPIYTADKPNIAKVDLSNLNTEGKNLISGLGMPSNRYIDLTLGVSGSTYTAPANGWFIFKNDASSVNAFFIVLTNKTSFISSSCTAYGAINEPMEVFVPVMKNDTVQAVYSGGTKRYFRFIYAEGEV